MNTKPADTICTVCSNTACITTNIICAEQVNCDPVHTHTHTDRFKLLSITACGIGNNKMLEKGYSGGVVLTLAVVNDS